MDVRLTGHGVEQFESERLSGRRLLPADQDFLAELHADATVMDLHDGPRSTSITERFVRSNVAHWRRYRFGLYIVATLDEPDRPIGRAGLRWDRSLDGDPTVDVNCVLVERVWGQGYATELFQVLTAIGLDLDLPLSSGTQARHVRARTALETTGFLYERDYERHDRGWVRYEWPTDREAPATVVGPPENQSGN